MLQEEKSKMSELATRSHSIIYAEIVGDRGYLMSRMEKNPSIESICKTEIYCSALGRGRVFGLLAIHYLFCWETENSVE